MSELVYVGSCDIRFENTVEIRFEIYEMLQKKTHCQGDLPRIESNFSKKKKHTTSESMRSALIRLSENYNLL